MQPLTDRTVADDAASERQICRSRGSDRRKDLQALGIVVADCHDLVLSHHELDRLEDLCRSVRLEMVYDGDSGDKHTLQVGRFLKAPPGQAPIAVSETTGEVLEILGNTRMTSFLQGLLDTDQTIYFRRGQVNIISGGGFVGPHIDRDADPDYELVLILHLKCSYEGGAYVVQAPASGENIKYRPDPHTILIGRTDVNHWVEKVNTGERRTLVMFASTYGGANRKAQV